MSARVHVQRFVRRIAAVSAAVAAFLRGFTGLSGPGAMTGQMNTPREARRRLAEAAAERPRCC